MKKLLVMIACAACLCALPAIAQVGAPELNPGETMETLAFPAVPMQIKGWTKLGRGKVYTLPVKAGQHVKISFASPMQYAFMAIFDLSKPEDESFFGSDEDGRVADLTVKEDTTWLIRPYYSRVSPRRGLGAPYTILIEPQNAAPAQPPASPRSPQSTPSP